jgi:hypothetical protein
MEGMFVPTVSLAHAVDSLMPILGRLRSPLNWRLIPELRGRAASHGEPGHKMTAAPVIRNCGASSPSRNQPKNRLH